MDLWAARDMHGKLFVCHREPWFEDGFIELDSRLADSGLMFISDGGDILPDLLPGHKCRVRLVLDGEPAKGES